MWSVHIMADTRADTVTYFLVAVVVAAVSGLIYMGYSSIQKDAEIDRLKDKIAMLERDKEQLKDQTIETFEKYTDILNETLKKIPSGTDLQKITSAQKEIAKVYDNCMKVKEDHVNCINRAERLNDELVKCKDGLEQCEKARKSSFFNFF